MATIAIPLGYYSAIRAAESGDNDAAKNPRSSALGPYQFTAGTWADVIANHPDLGLTPEGRSDPAQQDKAIKALTEDNAQSLKSAGYSINPANLYAAHFLGPTGAIDVLGKDASTPLTDILPPKVIKANPFLKNMNVGDFQAWTAQKTTSASTPEAIPSASNNNLVAAALPSATPASLTAPPVPTNNLMALSLIGSLMNRPQQQMQMPQMQVQQPISPMGNQLTQIIQPFRPQFVTSGNALIPSFG